MVEQFYQKGIEFLQRLFAEIDSSEIDLSTWDIDHICYRTETLPRYHELKTELQTIGTLLTETEVNGRPISTFELARPIEWQHRSIALVELPAPKLSKPTAEGFEHIEVVAPIPLEDLQNQYSNHKLDSRGLSKAFNRELEIELQSGAIKFHNLSLASVVEVEKNQKVFGATVRSGILTLLRPYGPLIAGTFPLGVTTPKSDVDILCATLDPVGLKLLLEKTYSSQEDFQAHYKLRAGKPVLVVSFKFDGVPFEIFAQEIPSVQQTAYRHFLIEERLLKLGRTTFKEAVMNRRKDGLKTEAAFASALQLNGDPYISLLALENSSESELKLALTQAGF
jgi:predicted metalloenzyme YecM